MCILLSESNVDLLGEKLFNVDGQSNYEQLNFLDRTLKVLQAANTEPIL